MWWNYVYFFIFFLDEFNQQIKEEKEKQAELDMKIHSKGKEIKEKHKHMGGVHASQKHTQKTIKAIRVKENRLHQVRY